MGDDIWIMGYAQRDIVNGKEERSGVLDLSEATDGGESVFQLGRSYWPRPDAGRCNWGHEVAGRGSDEREVRRGLEGMEMEKGANKLARLVYSRDTRSRWHMAGKKVAYSH